MLNTRLLPNPPVRLLVAFMILIGCVWSCSEEAKDEASSGDGTSRRDLKCDSDEFCRNAEDVDMRFHNPENVYCHDLPWAPRDCTECLRDSDCPDGYICVGFETCDKGTREATCTTDADCPNGPNVPLYSKPADQIRCVMTEYHDAPRCSECMDSSDCNGNPCAWQWYCVD